MEKAASMRLNAINDVLWNSTCQCWYDYSISNNKQLPKISSSNYIPLWVLPYNETLGTNVLNSLKESGLIQVGGVATTLTDDRQQWDYPNAWPPIQYILAQTGNKYKTINVGNWTQFNISQTYINAAYIGFNQTGFMFEKYMANETGQTGHGGEYIPQKGFAWSNSVVFSFLNEYGDVLTAPF